MIESLANILLYICFSLLMGYFVLHAIPQTYRPRIVVSTNGMRFLLILIPFLLLVPVIRVIITLYQQFSVPLGESIGTVALEYSIGHAFVLSVVVTSFMFVFLSKLKGSWVAVSLVGFLVVLGSWSSHGAAVAGTFGFVGNSLHLLAVSVWIGILAVVAWFGKDGAEIQSFTKWFSIVAVCSVLVIIISGFMLMGAIVPEYVQSWLLTYGQLLFIKHLLFLPLLIFGLHHLLLGLKKKVDHGNVVASFQVESILALFIFGISAFMTEQTPPHEVAQTLQTEQVSRLMDAFLSDHISVGAIYLSASIVTIMLFVTALLLFIYASWSLFKPIKVMRATVIFAISIVLMYITVMLSVDMKGYEQDDTVYSSIEEALSQTYDEDTMIDILVTEQHDDQMNIVYMVNQHELVAERLEQVEDGYKRLPAAMLTIGGTAVLDEKQKIRTFRVQSGNWHNDSFAYTYVTFGMIQEPVDVARVQIHYEGGSYIAGLEEETFINVVSSNENWADQHPIDFLADNGQVIETYARNVMEEGVYCH
ncbi:CopD family protein [Alkalihalobacillus sp. MEB130]|uniref:copper resistance D family protein n=1 Tax=Alkalihalobacillus sp. MEB130 TaxID=2976704 RepID=UPI0028DE9CE0|nr:CopD family protein [Alkalihalobacillus sp. MEB130]MDT8860574.1 CopD family protein [Alkalihalobacillus sp. MEB130]